MAAHRYWRLYITENWASGYTTIADMELRATVGGADLTDTAGGTPSASRAYSPAGYAFDNTTTNAYVADSNAPVWVKWDFGAGNDQSVGEVVVVNGGGSGGWSSETFVKTATLQFSDDNVAWQTHINTLMPKAIGAVAFPYVEIVPSTAYLSAPVGLLQMFGGGNASSFGPTPLLSMYSGASALLKPPGPTTAFVAGLQVALNAPSPTLSATAHDSYGEQAAFLAAPSPVLTITTGANGRVTTPAPALTAAGTVTGWGKAALSAPAPALTATGAVSAMADTALNGPSPNLVGYSGAVCSITLTGSSTIQAAGTTGSIGGAALTCPLFELSASGTAQGYGFANLRAPAGHMGATARAWLTAPSPMLTATGHAVVAATYEAYAINLNHAPGDQAPVDEVTHYTNFPFNGIVRYQSSYYGWGDDGLYLLEGTMDDANEIPYAVRTCIDDFKLTNEKNVVSAYFAGRIGPDMTVTLYAGEDGQASYNYHTANGSQARTHREKFARGVTDRYFAIGVSGKGALELADIELEINKLKRKT